MSQLGSGKAPEGADDRISMSGICLSAVPRFDCVRLHTVPNLRPRRAAGLDAWKPCYPCASCSHECMGKPRMRRPLRHKWLESTKHSAEEGTCSMRSAMLFTVPGVHKRAHAACHVPRHAVVHAHGPTLIALMLAVGCLMERLHLLNPLGGVQT